MHSGLEHDSVKQEPRRRRFGRVLLGVVVVLVLIAVLAPRFIIGPLLKRSLVSTLAKDGARAKIRRLRYGYFRGVKAKSVSIEWSSGMRLEAKNIRADLGLGALAGPLFADELHIDSLSVALPRNGGAAQVTQEGKKAGTPKSARKKRETYRGWKVGRIRIDAFLCDCGAAWKEPVSAAGITIERSLHGPSGPIKAKSKSGSGSAAADAYYFKAQRLVVGTNVLSDLSGDVKIAGDAGLSIGSKAKLNGTGSFDLALDVFCGAETEYHLDLDMKGALPSRQGAKLLRYIHPVFASLKSDHIKGSLSVNASLVAHGGTRDEILDTLSGTGAVSLTGGTLKLPGALAALIEYSRKMRIGSGGTVPVPNTAVQFAVRQGKIYNDDLRVGRAVLGTYARGWTSTRGKLDQILLVKALELTGKRGEVLAELIDDEAIPLVRVTGTIGGKIKYEPCIDRALAGLRQAPREQMEHLLGRLPDAERERLLDALNSGQDEFLQVFRKLLEEAAGNLAAKHGGAGEIIDQVSTKLERGAEKTRLRRWKKRWKKALLGGTLAAYREKCAAKDDKEELEALDEWLRSKGISPDNIPAPPKPHIKKK